MLEESSENITKSESNFAPSFADHHLLSDMTLNGYCLISNNISIPKKSNKSIYLLQTRSTIKKSKHRFYIR